MNYQYSGRNVSGERIKGKIEADSKQAALLQLEEKGLIIFDIDETKPWNKDIILNKTMKNKEFIVFLRQYATLIHAGISLSDATKTMITQSENYTLINALTDINKQLDNGQALSKATERHPKVFPALLVHMINAGEVSGKLDEILNQMADYYEKEYENQQKIISALLYPSIVGVITMLLSIFLLVFIVPQFVGMFESFGEEIPAFTQFVMSLSDWMSDFWWVLFTIVALCFGIYKYLKTYDFFVYRIDVLKLKFPFFGILVHKGVLVRMTQTLSTLVNSSVPIMQSVEITEQVVGNRVIEEVLVEARKSLAVGESITKPMKDHWAFPPLVIQMIQVGEKTGTLDEMLQKVAAFFEEEVKQLSDRIKVLIEPIMIIILTFVVGSIIAAIVIPMFTLFENF